MKPEVELALQRALAAERSGGSMLPGPKRGAGRSVFTLAMGLVSTYSLLTKLLPRLWSHALPGGLEQARHLPGWPGALYLLAEACYVRFWFVTGCAIAVVVFASFLGRCGWLGRTMVWLAAVGVVLADVGIAYVIVSTTYQTIAPGVPKLL